MCGKDRWVMERDEWHGEMGRERCDAERDVQKEMYGRNRWAERWAERDVWQKEMGGSLIWVAERYIYGRGMSG